MPNRLLCGTSNDVHRNTAANIVDTFPEAVTKLCVFRDPWKMWN